MSQVELIIIVRPQQIFFFLGEESLHEIQETFSLLASAS